MPWWVHGHYIETSVMAKSGGGVIVNVGSSSVNGGRPGQAAYSSSKVGYPPPATGVAYVDVMSAGQMIHPQVRTPGTHAAQSTPPTNVRAPRAVCTSTRPSLRSGLDLAFLPCYRFASRRSYATSNAGSLFMLYVANLAVDCYRSPPFLSLQAGIQSLTETLALEGRESGVLAYCVVPSRTDTPLRQALEPNEKGVGCLKPWDVAEVIVSCATTANPLLTGQAFWLT